MRRSWRALHSTHSACPPSRCRPSRVRLGQALVNPRAQLRQRRQGTSGLGTTRSPARQPDGAPSGAPG